MIGSPTRGKDKDMKSENKEILNAIALRNKIAEEVYLKSLGIFKYHLENETSS